MHPDYDEMIEFAPSQLGQLTTAKVLEPLPIRARNTPLELSYSRNASQFGDLTQNESARETLPAVTVFDDFALGTAPGGTKSATGNFFSAFQIAGSVFFGPGFPASTDPQADLATVMLSIRSFRKDFVKRKMRKREAGNSLPV